MAEYKKETTIQKERLLCVCLCVHVSVYNSNVLILSGLPVLLLHQMGAREPESEGWGYIEKEEDGNERKRV